MAPDITPEQMMRDLTNALGPVFRCLKSITIKELPHEHLDGPAFNLRLPSVCAVYFLMRESGKLLYVGRALDLKLRWRSTHHRQEAALKLRDVSLYWLVCPFERLDVIEHLFIATRRPAWNRKSRKPLPVPTFEQLREAVCLHDDDDDVVPRKKSPADLAADLAAVSRFQTVDWTTTEGRRRAMELVTFEDLRRAVDPEYEDD